MTDRAFGKTRRYAIVAAAVLAAATASAQATSQAAAKKPTEPTLKGHISLWRQTGDHIDFTFDARGLGPVRPDNPDPTKGAFTGRHFDAANKKGVWWDGHIDCMIVAARTATFTVVVDHAHSTPGAPDVSATVGKRQGFTIAHPGGGRHDRFGYDWIFSDPGKRSVPECMGPAPFEYVKSGKWTMTEWFPFPHPKGW